MWSPKIQRLRNVVLRKEAKALLDAIEKVAEEAHTPTDEMVAEAKRGLEWRRKFNRGGTEVGVARARDISNRKSLPVSTLKRMHSYFARHEVDKEGKGFYEGDKGFPSAGRIAWALWGGDAGKAWVNKMLGHHDKDSAVNIVDDKDNLRAPSTEDEATMAGAGGSPGNAGDSYSKTTVITPTDVFRNASLDRVSHSLVAAFDKLAAANSIVKLVGLPFEVAKQISEYADKTGNKSSDVALARYFKAWSAYNGSATWDDFTSQVDNSFVNAIVNDRGIAEQLAALSGKKTLTDINSMISSAVKQYAGMNSDDKFSLIPAFASKYSLSEEVVSELYDDNITKPANEAVVKMFKAWVDRWKEEHRLNISTLNLRDNLAKNLPKTFYEEMDAYTRNYKVGKWFNRVADYTDGKNIIDYIKSSDASAKRILKTNYAGKQDTNSDADHKSQLDSIFEDAAHIAAREYSTSRFEEEAKTPLIKFDDGTYWVKVDKKKDDTTCPHEAYAMGHCGQAGSTMYSLRGANNRPIATIDVSKTGEIMQARGNGNKMISPLLIGKLGAVVDAGIASSFNDPHVSTLGDNQFDYINLVSNLMPLGDDMANGLSVYKRLLDIAKSESDVGIATKIADRIKQRPIDVDINSDSNVSQIYYDVLKRTGAFDDAKMIEDIFNPDAPKQARDKYNAIQDESIKECVDYLLADLYFIYETPEEIERSRIDEIHNKYANVILDNAHSGMSPAKIVAAGAEAISLAYSEVDPSYDSIKSDRYKKMRNEIAAADELIDSGELNSVGTIIEENVQPIREQIAKQMQLANVPHEVVLDGPDIEQYAPPGEAILHNPDLVLDPQYGLITPETKLSIDAMNHMISIGAGEYYDQLAESVSTGKIKLEEILNMTLDDVRNLVNDETKNVPGHEQLSSSADAVLDHLDSIGGGMDMSRYYSFITNMVMSGKINLADVLGMDFDDIVDMHAKHSMAKDDISGDKVAMAITHAYKKLSSRGQSISDLTQSGRGSRPFNGPLDESLTGDSSAKIGTEKDSKVNEPYTNNGGHDSKRFDEKMNIVKGADSDEDGEKVAVGLPDQGVDENKYNDRGRADMAIPRPPRKKHMIYRKT